MDKIQQDFEEWARRHRMPLHKDGVVVAYAARCTDEAWQAWRASREAIELQMPAYASTPGGATFDAVKVLQVIGDAGLKARV